MRNNKKWNLWSANVGRESEGRDHWKQDKIYETSVKYFVGRNVKYFGNRLMRKI
jgi:hypothetical protein